MIGNQSLYIYKDFLPNTDNGTYFRFTNINDYINYINTNYGINEVLTVDNYRLNTNVLKVSFDYFKRNLIDYRKITYLRLQQRLSDTHVSANIINTFYYVKSATLQSDYVTFSIELDYWATYQYLLDNHKIMLNRTNAILENEVKEIDNKLYVYDNTKLVVIHDISDKKINYLEEHYKEGLSSSIKYKSDEEIDKLVKENLELFDKLTN